MAIVGYGYCRISEIMSMEYFEHMKCAIQMEAAILTDVFSPQVALFSDMHTHMPVLHFTASGSHCGVMVKSVGQIPGRFRISSPLVPWKLALGQSQADSAWAVGSGSHCLQPKRG